MSGDVNNVTVWSEGDVLTAPLTATLPVGLADFALTGTDPWSFAGILDGAAGFTESQSFTSTPHTGWGVGEIATTRKDLAITRQFTALEENATTLAMRYDTSGITFTGADYTGELAGRNLQDKFKMAFDLRSGGKTKRLITKNFAQIEALGDVVEGEDNLASLPVTVKIYPSIVDGKPVYWITAKGTPA